MSNVCPKCGKGIIAVIEAIEPSPRVKEVYELLDYGPMTINEIMDVADYDRQEVRDILTVLVDKKGVVGGTPDFEYEQIEGVEL